MIMMNDIDKFDIVVVGAITFAFITLMVVLFASMWNTKENKKTLETYLDNTDATMIVYVDGLDKGEQSIDIDGLLNTYTIDRIDEDSDTLYLNTVQRHRFIPMPVYF